MGVDAEAADLVAVFLLLVVPVLVEAVDQLPGMLLEDGGVEVAGVFDQGGLQEVSGLVGELVGELVPTC